MSINKYDPHIIVISEDKANRDIANGFVMQDHVRQRNIHVLPKSLMNNKGGWRKVVNWFVETQASIMQSNKNRIAILLIDFDEKENYLGVDEKESYSRYHREYASKIIPANLQDRVFILGCWDEPEKIKNLGTPEEIGEGLAQDCYDNTDNFWKHEQLKHNQDELKRMYPIVNRILFGK
jgi:hypothetical protein